MPILEFVCPNGHVTAKLILSAKAAEGIEKTPCEYADGAMSCRSTAHRAIVTPPTPHFAPGGVGGFYKPGVGTIGTKTDPTRYVKEAMEQMGGVEGIKKIPEIAKYKPKGLSVDPKQNARTKVRGIPMKVKA